MGPQVLDDFLHYHCILHLVGRLFLSGIHVFLDRITAIGVSFKVGVLLSHTGLVYKSEYSKSRKDILQKLYGYAWFLAKLASFTHRYCRTAKNLYQNQSAVLINPPLADFSAHVQLTESCVDHRILSIKSGLNLYQLRQNRNTEKTARAEIMCHVK